MLNFTKREDDLIEECLNYDAVLVLCGENYLPVKQLYHDSCVEGMSPAKGYCLNDDKPPSGYEHWYGVFEDNGGWFPLKTFFPVDHVGVEKTGQLTQILVEGSFFGNFGLYRVEWILGLHGFSELVGNRFLIDWYLFRNWEILKESSYPDLSKHQIDNIAKTLWRNISISKQKK